MYRFDQQFIAWSKDEISKGGERAARMEKLMNATHLFEKIAPYNIDGSLNLFLIKFCIICLEAQKNLNIQPDLVERLKVIDSAAKEIILQSTNLGRTFTEAGLRFLVLKQPEAMYSQEFADRMTTHADAIDSLPETLRFVRVCIAKIKTVEQRPTMIRLGERKAPSHIFAFRLAEHLTPIVVKSGDEIENWPDPIPLRSEIIETVNLILDPKAKYSSDNFGTLMNGQRKAGRVLNPFTGLKSF